MTSRSLQYISCDWDASSSHFPLSLCIGVCNGSCIILCHSPVIILIVFTEFALHEIINGARNYWQLTNVMYPNQQSWQNHRCRMAWRTWMTIIFKLAVTSWTSEDSHILILLRSLLRINKSLCYCVLMLLHVRWLDFILHKSLLVLCPGFIG